jgi:hypothetical protein
MRTVDLVKRETALHFRLTRSEIEGPQRSKRVAHPRQLGMTLSRFYTSLSLSQIGQAFGGRDHTTALHAMRRVDARLQEPGFSRLVGEVCLRIEQHLAARRIADLNRPPFAPPAPAAVRLLPAPKLQAAA